MDRSQFFATLTPLGARLQGLETKKFEISHCAHTWLDKTAAKLHRLFKAFNPFFADCVQKRPCLWILKSF